MSSNSIKPARPSGSASSCACTFPTSFESNRNTTPVWSGLTHHCSDLSAQIELDGLANLGVDVGAPDAWRRPGLRRERSHGEDLGRGDREFRDTRCLRGALGPCRGCAGGREHRRERDRCSDRSQGSARGHASISWATAAGRSAWIQWPPSRRMQGRRPESGREVLADVGRDVRVERTPDDLDGHVERLELRQAPGVSGELREEPDASWRNAGPELGCFVKLSAISAPVTCSKCAFCCGGSASANFAACQPSSQPNCAGLCATAWASARKSRIREQRDHLRPEGRLLVVVGRIQEVQRGDSLRMVQREIDRGRTRRVVCHRNERTEGQRLGDTGEVAELLREAVGGARRLVGSAES